MRWFDWYNGPPEPLIKSTPRYASVELFDIIRTCEPDPRFVDKAGYNDAVRAAAEIMKSELVSMRSMGIPRHKSLRHALAIAIRHRNRLMAMDIPASTPRIEI